MQFERMGCFAYSQEEDTPAASLPDQVEEEVKEHRAEILMDRQMAIMEARAWSWWAKPWRCWWRASTATPSAGSAAPTGTPRTIDGKVFFTTEGKRPRLGSFVKVTVTGCMDCDLTGELVE